MGIKTPESKDDRTNVTTDKTANVENTGSNVSQEVGTKITEPEDVIANEITDEKDTAENKVSVLNGGRPDFLDKEDGNQPFESDDIEITVSQTGEFLVPPGCPGGSHASCIRGGCSGVAEILESYRFCVDDCLIRCKGIVA